MRHKMCGKNMNLKLHEFDTKVKLNHGIKRFESQGLEIADHGIYTKRVVIQEMDANHFVVTDQIVYYIWTKNAELSTLETKE